MITWLSKLLLVSFCVATVLANGSCTRDSYEVKLSGPVEITDQWTLFQANPTLRADKDDAAVVIELDSPYRSDFYKEGKGPNVGNGILMPDGEVINPDIEIVDQHANTFKLVYAGSRRTFWPAYDLPYPNEWPRNREFKTVRIRSSRPIKCKAIYWFSESGKDLK